MLVGAPEFMRAMLAGATSSTDVAKRKGGGSGQRISSTSSSRRRNSLRWGNFAMISGSASTSQIWARAWQTGIR